MKNRIAKIYSEMGGKNDHDYLKKVVWAARPYQIDNLLDNYIDYLVRMDLETVDDATTVLLDMALYEESDAIRNSAANALYDLHEHFSRAHGADAIQNKNSLKKAVDAVRSGD